MHQALGDLAYFISEIKQDATLKNSQVIVFGGSYPGNLAVWMRLKYPNLVQVTKSITAHFKLVNNF